MDTYGTIVKFFQEGGIFMYPIALIAALGAAVAIERWLHLWRTESANWRPIASAIVTAWLAFWSVTVMSTSRLPDGLIAVTRVASRSTVVDSPSRVITGSSTRWLRTMPVKERTFC